MCGIVAVLARRSTRAVPDASALLADLEQATGDVHLGWTQLEAGDPGAIERLQVAAESLAAVDAALRGVPGLECLLGASAPAGAAPSTLAGAAPSTLAAAPSTLAGAAPSTLAAAPSTLAGAAPSTLAAAPPTLAGEAVAGEALAGPLATLPLVERVAEVVLDAAALVGAAETALDSGQVMVTIDQADVLNAVLLRLKDLTWAISRDRVGMARAVADLAGEGTPLTADRLAALWAIQVGLASLDRLEVRGRDSAGLHVLVHGQGLDLEDPRLQALIGQRRADPLFTSRAVRVAGGCLSLVYKTAAEIGELGDNVAALRASIRTDPLLARVLAGPGVEVTVLGHTRWASVGIISEPNAHPLNSDRLDVTSAPYVTAALNGDVDNYLELRISEALDLPAEVTTDAKVIPTLISKRLDEGLSPEEAFNETVARFTGSVAIAASLADTPDQLHLALRGSGQALFVGLAEDAFVVASEAYGLVEETSRYVRMDGEATQGQTVVLDRAGAGTLEGLARFRYDGGALALTPEDIRRAEITTRDIDRAGHAHFLLKEIGEAPRSFRKTLRGRVVPGAAGLEVRLGPETLPPALALAVATGTLRRVAVIGQGTAAVAGQAVAAAIRRCLSGRDGLPPVEVVAMPATELSGFGLSDDMSDTLVVAVSQSGSTTDTNRTVDLVRGRGAHVVAVLNRRNSDLAAKSHGVLYTSDGRDIEMSVASTKAFYAQVAAGWLLALGLARAGGAPAADEDRLLTALRELPDAMEEVLSQGSRIGETAALVAPPRRSWAIVGSGPERVAAAEVRIKLSELCYKAIACDATEDKKHIDLSSEPMILVFAGGLSGPNADDVAKEVAIYKAHKAAPVVVASAGEGKRFTAALDVIEVPRCDPDLAFVLSAMAGHLFGYHAALAIDAQALPLREARAAIEQAAAGGLDVDGEAVLASLSPALSSISGEVLKGLRSGRYNGHLDVATALDVTNLMRFATGASPLDAYQTEMGKVGTPSVVVSDLYDALSAGIDQLTRPIDAIKHQAKTVTVGISRSEDALLRLRLVKETLSAGPSADQLGYRAMRTLAALDAAVEEVLGYTRYGIGWTSGPPGTKAGPTIWVVDQGGMARNLRSRTDADHRLRGTKHRAADEREVTVARGRSDGRTVVMVPETRGIEVTGMTLLHVRFADVLDAPVAREVLGGYRDRLIALADAVTETERTFDESLLGVVPIVELLTDPVYVLAERWWQR